jgi:hypothetical protein
MLVWAPYVASVYCAGLNILCSSLGMTRAMFQRSCNGLCKKTCARRSMSWHIVFPLIGLSPLIRCVVPQRCIYLPVKAPMGYADATTLTITSAAAPTSSCSTIPAFAGVAAALPCPPGPTPVEPLGSCESEKLKLPACVLAARVNSQQQMSVFAVAAKSRITSNKSTEGCLERAREYLLSHTFSTTICAEAAVRRLVHAPPHMGHLT